MTQYFAEGVDESSEFYLFRTERARDRFIRRRSDENWKFGRVVDDREITDGWA